MDGKKFQIALIFGLILISGFVFADCTDSDGGLNLNVVGTATSSTAGIEGRQDCCKAEYSTYMGDAVAHIGLGGGPCTTTGSYLYEAICGANGVPTTAVYTCPNGCSNGACIQTACTDSDGGKNYNVSGNVLGVSSSGEVVSGNDYCMGNVLKELYCDASGFVNTDAYTCPNGCSNGACVSGTASSCTDSDGGDNPDAVGTVTYNGATFIAPDTGTTNKYTDRCYVQSNGDQAVTEFSCSNNNLIASNHYCPNGCSNGACLSSKQITKCEGSTDMNNFNGGSIVVTYSNDAKETLQDTCGYGSAGYVYGAKHYFCNLPGYEAHYWTVVKDCKTEGKVCQNGVCVNQTEIRVISPNGGETFKTGDFVTIQWTPGSPGISQIYFESTTRDYTNNVMATLPNTAGSFTFRIPDNFPADSYVAKIYKYNGVQGYADSSDAPFSIVSGGGICTDSDGGKNYYVKGSADAPTGRLDDACDTDGTRLFEYYCSNGQQLQDQYSCPYGCRDGACVGLTVISPNGGEQLAIGTVSTITWNLHVGVTDSYKVALFLLDLNGVKLGPVGVESANKGQFRWNISTINWGGAMPQPIKSGAYRIRAELYNGTPCLGGVCNPGAGAKLISSDDSDALFKIASVGGGTCTDSDNGKDYYTRGRAAGPYGSDKQIGVIWGEEPNRCSARWDYSLGTSYHYDCCSDNTLNNQLNEAYCENGIMMSTAYNCPYGCSNGACIQAQPGQIKLMFPNGGEKIVQGTINRIYWTGGTCPASTGSVGCVKISLHKIENGVSSHVGWIGTGYPDGSISWDGRQVCSSLDSGGTCTSSLTPGYYSIMVSDGTTSSSSDYSFVLLSGTEKCLSDSDCMEISCPNGEFVQFVHEVCESGQCVLRAKCPSSRIYVSVQLDKYKYSPGETVKIKAAVYADGQNLPDNMNLFASITKPDGTREKIQLFRKAPCPQYSTPSPDWCKNGKIVSGGTDANGCVQPPNCAEYCGSGSANQNCVCKDGETKTYVPGLCPAVIGGHCIDNYACVSGTANCPKKIMLPAPNFCPNGNIVTNKDANGCVIGYGCSTLTPQLQSPTTTGAATAKVAKKMATTGNVVVQPLQAVSAVSAVSSASASGGGMAASTVASAGGAGSGGSIAIPVIKQNGIEFSATYENTKQAGDYRIEVSSDSVQIQGSSASFIVVDNALISRYVITNDISDYKFGDSSKDKSPIGALNPDVYGATYRNDIYAVVVKVAQFTNKEDSQKALALFRDQARQEGHALTPDEINGQSVLVLSRNQEEIVLWTHDNFIVITTWYDMRGIVYAQQTTSQASTVSAGLTMTGGVTASNVQEAAISTAASAGKTIRIDNYVDGIAQIRNTGISAISSGDIRFYVDGVVARCSFDGSIGPAETKACRLSVSCGNGDVLRATAPGNTDEISCSARICPAVCVPMWRLNNGQCSFTGCGSGCGPDGKTTFSTQEACQAALGGSNACVQEGGSIPVIANPPVCCAGLTLIRPKVENLVGSHGICTAKCGNGVCDTSESAYNCAQDCISTACPKLGIGCLAGSTLFDTGQKDSNGCPVYKCTKYCGDASSRGSSDPNCYCNENEVKERVPNNDCSGNQNCIAIVRVPAYRCVPKETPPTPPSDIPLPVINAYLQKYPSDLATVPTDSLLERYLILRDIGAYKFVDTNIGQDSSYGVTLGRYSAIYNNSGKAALVIVGEFNSRADLEKLLEQSKKDQQFTAANILGNSVLTHKSDSGPQTAWTNKNFIIVVKLSPDDLPEEQNAVLKAYLQKYPSDLGVKLEIKEVDSQDLVNIALKLETLRVTFDQLQRNVVSLADYYRNSGDQVNAQKFDRVAGMFGTAKGMVDDIKTNIRANIDNPGIVAEVKQDVGNLKSYVREIVLVILGDSVQSVASSATGLLRGA
jgi:hypothetical protein